MNASNDNNAQLDALESNKCVQIIKIENTARELLSNIVDMTQQQKLMKELIVKYGKDFNDVQMLKSLIKSEKLNKQLAKEKQKQREIRAKDKAKIARLNKKKSALIGEIMLKLKDENEIVRLAYDEVINAASEDERKVLDKSS